MSVRHPAPAHKLLICRSARRQALGYCNPAEGFLGLLQRVDHDLAGQGYYAPTWLRRWLLDFLADANTKDDVLTVLDRMIEAYGNGEEAS